ncbi:unnamed protein product [Musa acuminata subsp. burmannicoides]
MAASSVSVSFSSSRLRGPRPSSSHRRRDLLLRSLALPPSSRLSSPLPYASKRFSSYSQVSNHSSDPLPRIIPKRHINLVKVAPRIENSGLLAARRQWLWFPTLGRGLAISAAKVTGRTTTMMTMRMTGVWICSRGSYTACSERSLDGPEGPSGRCCLLPFPLNWYAQPFRLSDDRILGLLVGFSVNGVLILASLWILKAFLEVICTFGSMVFISILLVRGIWSGISYIRINQYSYKNTMDDEDSRWSGVQPT